MKKVLVLLLVIILGGFSFGCGKKEVPSYEGSDPVPDFGQYLQDAQLMENESKTLENVFEGGNKPKVYFYHIPTADKEKSFGYVDLLKEKGFVSEDGKDLTEVESTQTYKNEDAGLSVMFSIATNTNDASVFNVIIMIFRT